MKSPLSSHKTTLKQQINGQKQWKMKEKDLFWLSFYSLFGAWKIVGMIFNLQSIFHLIFKKCQQSSKQTLNPTSYTHQHVHSQVKHFNKLKKYNSSNSTQIDKIPAHGHLYSVQYYNINSIANPHTETEQSKITGIIQNRNLTY